jgi:hypothetical protein
MAERPDRFISPLRSTALILNEPIGAFALQALARSYVLQQQPGKARVSYREFMSVWHKVDARAQA